MANIFVDIGTTQFRGRSQAAGNRGLAIAGGQWLLEVLNFYLTYTLDDRLVPRNARHRQAPNRNEQA